MLSHASSVNSKRLDARMKRDKEDKSKEDDDPIVWKGKHLSELNSEEMGAYMGSGL
jgi:hypothetical protein